MFYTYVHIRPDTGVIFYVGKGSKKRAYSPRNQNKHWASIVKKNGGDFTVQILNWFTCEGDAYEAEIWQINKLLHTGELTNKTPGGEGVRGEIISGDNNHMRRPEYRNRMRGAENPMRRPGVAEKAAEKNRGQKRSEEFCKRYLGHNNPMFGKAASDIQKEAVRKAQLGKPKQHTQRSKTALKVKGRNNGMYGRFGQLNPMFGKVSAMKGRTNPMASFANYVRHVPYWGA